MADFFGFNFPFFGETFVLPRQAGARLIKNDVKQLLLTAMGERVMRNDYGTSIRRTPFEPLDDLTLVELKNEIQSVLGQFEPRVNFRDVKFVTQPDKNYMEIIVIMSLTRDPNVVLDVSINTAPGDSSQPLQGV